MKRTRFWVGVLAAAALLSVGAILLLGRWSGGGTWPVSIRTVS